jgi:peptidoglycan/LPS O-acetylase OafA/YrhL
MEEEEKKKLSEEQKSMLLRSKQRYEILDGLRGVASLIVIIFHFFELYSLGNPSEQIINHGYLAVDFFYVLSGFILGYAYDDRWNRMSLWDFYKRRLIRLHPMVIAGSLIGACYYFLGEGSNCPNIESVKPYYFFLTIIMNLLMIPTPVEMDIRGWGETNSFNGPNWTLSYEYLINILYSLVIRRLHTIIIGILALLSSLLLVNLALNFDIFKVMQERESNKYTVIGGWSLTSCELYIGFTRLFYPFFAGYLVYRLKLKIKIPCSFIICSLILIIFLCFPRVGSGDYAYFNGIYEASVIILIFPLVIMIGAGDNTNNEIIIKICKFLGDISYPIYITHYPIIYMNSGWTAYHMDDSLFNKIMLSIGSFVIMMFNAYSLVELYDKPVRKWLADKYIVKKLKKEENNNRMNYNRINDSVLDSEDDKKKIVLKENDESNNINEK